MIAEKYVDKPCMIEIKRAFSHHHLSGRRFAKSQCHHNVFEYALMLAGLQAAAGIGKQVMKNRLFIVIAEPQFIHGTGAAQKIRGDNERPKL